MKKIESSHLELSRVEIWRADPITWYCYPNEQGIPMLVVGVVSNMVHANYPEESWIAYDQFLCQFSKDEEGNICYRGIKQKEEHVAKTAPLSFFSSILSRWNSYNSPEKAG